MKLQVSDLLHNIETFAWYDLEADLVSILMITGCVGDLHAVASQDWQRRSEVNPIQTRKPRTERSWSATRESWLPSNSWLYLDPSYIINTHIYILHADIHNTCVHMYMYMYTVSTQLDISCWIIMFPWVLVFVCEPELSTCAAHFETCLCLVFAFVVIGSTNCKATL